MESFEFKTKVKNGAIQIPEKYQKQIGDTVKVIIISDSAYDKGNQEKDPLKSNNFSPISRDEIYERL